MTPEREEIAVRSIERTVRHFVKVVPSLLRDHAVEDLVQETFCHFLEKKFFPKYDSAITSFEYFVARATKNFLIDIARKGTQPYESLDEEINDEEGSATKGDFVAGNMMDAFTMVLVKEMMASCPDTQISPNYSLSWKGLLQYFLEGYTVTELHKIVGISSGRISQLKSELEKILKGKMSLAVAL